MKTILTLAMLSVLIGCSSTSSPPSALSGTWHERDTTWWHGAAWNSSRFFQLDFSPSGTACSVTYWDAGDSIWKAGSTSVIWRDLAVQSVGDSLVIDISQPGQYGFEENIRLGAGTDTLRGIDGNLHNSGGGAWRRDVLFTR